MIDQTLQRTYKRTHFNVSINFLCSVLSVLQMISYLHYFHFNYSLNTQKSSFKSIFFKSSLHHKFTVMNTFILFATQNGILNKIRIKNFSSVLEFHFKTHAMISSDPEG